jgi:transcriptional regulator with XRE-family HTH domain
MEDKGLTQEKLAGMVGLSREAIQKYSEGRVPNDEIMYAIVEALGIKKTDLIFEEEHVLIGLSLYRYMASCVNRYLKIKELMCEEGNQ